MGPPLGASPPKRMTASWPGALAGSTECKVAARLLRPLRGSPRFVRDTRLSNPAEHSPPPPLWISGPPPPDSWRSLWRATYPQLPPLSICSRKGSHLEQSPVKENSPCKAQNEGGVCWGMELRRRPHAEPVEAWPAAPSGCPSFDRLGRRVEFAARWTLNDALMLSLSKHRPPHLRLRVLRQARDEGGVC